MGRYALSDVCSRSCRSPRAAAEPNTKKKSPTKKSMGLELPPFSVEKRGAFAYQLIKNWIYFMDPQLWLYDPSIKVESLVQQSKMSSGRGRDERRPDMPRDRGPKRRETDRSSPADEVSTGPGRLDRRNGAVRSSVRSHRSVRSQPSAPRRRHCRPGARLTVVARPPRPVWPDSLARGGRSAHLAAVRSTP